jgi:hypothetical protein
VITAQKFRGRRSAAAAAVALMAVGITGCTAINQQSTTQHYAPSDGVVFDVAGIDVRNLMFATNSQEQKARVLGSLVNDSDSAQTLTMTVDGNSVTMSVPAQTALKLEEDANKVILPTAGAEPGAHSEASFKVDGVTTQESVPVVDGTLAEYRPFIPGGYDQSTVQHLVPSAPATEHH